MGWNRWALVLGAAAALAIPACQSGEGETPEPARSAAPETQADKPKVVGTASCSATACHGGVDPRPAAEVRQDEYTRWVRHDRHASAYATLFNDKSVEMIRRLGEPGKPATPAHTNRRCLACHTSGGEEQAKFRHDGVGCEACHGPASQWLGEHTARASWKALSAEQRQQKGMTPLDDPAALARTCVGCHVGSAPDRDVDHDLIAAGHPRLAFDFAAYLANMPPHWNAAARDKARGPDFEARAWAVGTVVSAEYALELLAHRASDVLRWPEFAEYGCFACHQRLRSTTRSRGKPPWGTWGFPMLAPIAAEAKFSLASIDTVRALMEQPHPDGVQVARAATAAAKALKGSTAAVGKIAFANPATLPRLQGRVLTAGEPANWDEAAQVYFALAAITEARIRQEKWRGENAKQAREAILALHARLAFPPGQDSPQAFRAGANLRDVLDSFRR